jgi:hypothetical protein
LFPVLLPWLALLPGAEVLFPGTALPLPGVAEAPTLSGGVTILSRSALMESISAVVSGRFLDLFLLWRLPALLTVSSLFPVTKVSTVVVSVVTVTVSSLQSGVFLHEKTSTTQSEVVRKKNKSKVMYFAELFMALIFL